VESACLLHFSPPDREKIEYCRTVLQLLQDCSAGEGGGDQAAIGAWETAALLAPSLSDCQTKPGRGGAVAAAGLIDHGQLEN
jgi:hypothetical protein